MVEKHGSSAKEDELQKEDGMTERTIGSVLIATMAFTAAFTVPGGFVADDHAQAGTATLSRRFAFRAFVVSNTLAFLSSIIATCFLIYGGARKIPRSHRRLYNLPASGLVPVGAQFIIAAFAFGFHLVLGAVNRWLVIFVYILSLASVIVCFPGIWIPLHPGVTKAIWRRTGWRGFFTPCIFLNNLRRVTFAVLISTTFLVAIALSISLPDY